MSSIEFFVDGNPQPQPKVGGRHTIWATREHDKKGLKAAWRENIRLTAVRWMRLHNLKPFAPRTPLKVEVTIYRIKTRTYQKSDNEPYGKPDAENYFCLIANTLQGVTYHDDAQIVDQICRKRFATGLRNPGAMIQIKPVGETRM